ncbi:MAG: O-antigen ligase family protein, partial [Eudoraea sp.]|nr:O-antigen ligase family protein [Eudoraea sp.]
VLLQENFIFRFNAFVAKEMIHPTYLAMYFMLCLFWVLERFMIVKSARTKGLLLGASGVLLLLTVSLAAKMPLLELGIILLTVPAIYLLRNRKTKKLYWYLLGLTGLITLVVIFLIRVPNRAVQDVYDYYNFLSGKQLTDFYSYDELEVEYDKFWFEKTNRIVIWQNSIELAKAKPWIGYGTGDVQDKLIEVYQKNKELWRMQFFNSHNQFLDYQLRYGVLGALLLVVYLGYFFIYAWQNADYLYLSFIAMIALGFLTENIIQRHWGIVFFSLFNSLYYFRIRNAKSS